MKQVPGFLALACLPFPFIFYKYGAALRKRCKWTVKAAKLYAATNALVSEDKQDTSMRSQAQMSELHPQLSHHTKEAENHERDVAGGGAQRTASDVNMAAHNQAALNGGNDVSTVQNRV